MKAVLGLLLSSMLVLAAPSASAKKMRNPKTKVALAKAAKTTIDQAIEKAKAKAPGKVIEVELARHDTKSVWEVEILGDDGKITEVDVDTTSGEVMDSEEKD